MKPDNMRRDSRDGVCRQLVTLWRFAGQTVVVADDVAHETVGRSNIPRLVLCSP